MLFTQKVPARASAGKATDQEDQDPGRIRGVCQEDETTQGAHEGKGRRRRLRQSSLFQQRIALLPPSLGKFWVR